MMMADTDMNKEREYVFLSLMIPQQLAAEVKENSTNTMADAANALEHNLMQGFAANLLTAPKIVNVLPIGSYPQYYKKPFIKESTFSLCGRADHINLGFCNIKLIRNDCIERSVYRYLNDYCQKKNGEIILCIYSASAGFLSAAEKLKKKYPNIVICDVIADLPGMTNLSSQKSSLLRWFIDYKAKKSMSGLDSIDCFVFLTKQMAEYLHITKPFCVVEGIATETTELKRTELSDKKIILYTGTLHQKFGVMNLVKAFQQIDDPDYRLVICGIGDSAEVVGKQLKMILASLFLVNCQEMRCLNGKRRLRCWLTQDKIKRTSQSIAFPLRQWNTFRLEYRWWLISWMGFRMNTTSISSMSKVIQLRN